MYNCLAEDLAWPPLTPQVLEGESPMEAEHEEALFEVMQTSDTLLNVFLYRAEAAEQREVWEILREESYVFPCLGFPDAGSSLAGWIGLTRDE